MGFRPLHDRVVVKRLDSESKTAGGIIIPDTAKEKPMEGTVMSVGPGARDDNGRITPLDVKKGDTVLFGKWSGTCLLYTSPSPRDRYGSRMPSSA